MPRCPTAQTRWMNLRVATVAGPLRSAPISPSRYGILDPGTDKLFKGTRAGSTPLKEKQAATA
jgi:hypothetical protein